MTLPDSTYIKCLLYTHSDTFIADFYGDVDTEHDEHIVKQQYLNWNRITNLKLWLNYDTKITGW